MNLPRITIVMVFLTGAYSAPKSEFLRTVISSNEGEIQLNLRKPETPIFQDNFKVILSTRSESGETILLDGTPSKEIISQLDDQIHIDPDSNAVVRLTTVNGQTQLFGHINNRMISYHDGENIHKLVEESLSEEASDYLEIPEEIRLAHPPITANRSTDAVVTVELLIVVDNMLTLLLGGDVNRILEYYAIAVRSVNNRYATSLDPRVTVKLVGIVAIQNIANQPFIENHRGPDGNYDPNGILPDFGRYLVTNGSAFPPHDLGALLTGVSMGNIAGLAYRGGACRETVRASITLDAGAVFRGVGTLTHEMGHNLGSAHDGDAVAGTDSCPNEDRYLMSTTGGFGPNGYYFSTCSKAMMNTFFGTTNANCLYSQESPTWHTPSPLLPGDLINLDDFCRAYRPESYVSDTHTPDELCQNVRCKYRAPCPAPDENFTCVWTVTLNRMAPDGVSCGTGGRCTLGTCQN
ncbi:zinc metalloproteinase/disintegrin [Folsomia candida]|uniref:Venom metalloproteinase antarease-like n=1 Tax=Folsomia candida TaxID=158441 RepID=A0A226DHS2_FOLCA|nr:zinc metalloproteinase/disintegrin [Folsomia candida]OXA44498.1 Venom metalloproteinase antarease-like [Folsomia candida]